MLLEGRTVMLTGGASPRGIGRATARLLAEQGARVAILDLDGDAAAAAAREIGERHKGYACDVSDRRACDAAVARAREALGPADGLLTFAGISRSTRFLDVSAEEYERVMAVNARGAWNICQAVAPDMVERRRGAIVTVGSIAAQRGGGVFGGAHYSASKGAAQSLAKALARELAPHGVRVNAIAPGLVDTDIFEGALTEERKAEIRTQIPLQRIGRPEDVAGVCAFLISDWAAYVTGTVIDINGGLHIH